jgi:hypothetical protein
MFGGRSTSSAKRNLALRNPLLYYPLMLWQCPPKKNHF